MLRYRRATFLPPGAQPRKHCNNNTIICRYSVRARLIFSVNELFALHSLEEVDIQAVTDPFTK